MQPPANELEPPKDTPITVDELKEHDGSNDKPIYVAIKGTVFDVTKKKEMYGSGQSYNIFAGKDGSRGLGMSSLNPEDAVSDYSTLSEKELSVLDDWYKFFSKRYNIVGRVV
ncbi:cytochrome b5 [Wallemia mellicola CBS 633.66]|uniref:Cytochrome b5 n=1 Tax=Wallemia mellicola (strain ATCC MYA-4683 / CBS 633.66) TaxID=671144 RepID=I4YD61_WALMC|nr:cytochrome b5 [Wallemia mellicola CBS 633.66]EIM21903.1 cytochrome b5 [Wallemia mellicola CBS 633.66]|eukprot:XP_006958033.1 cytochrome b5 [Wallemia mellicola CBS 633.66]